ncbi:MAG: DUF1850 domain-containing protein [Hyphomicrobiaceae bacterium]
MPICLVAGTTTTVVALQAFTLAWTHSVERTGWEEDWRLGDGKLVLVEGRIKGSGAGMEPPENARLANGWWVYPGRGMSVERLRLANAGGAAGRWRVCAEGSCREIGTSRDAPDTLEIAPCAAQKGS